MASGHRRICLCKERRERTPCKRPQSAQLVIANLASRHRMGCLLTSIVFGGISDLFCLSRVKSAVHLAPNARLEKINEIWNSGWKSSNLSINHKSYKQGVCLSSTFARVVLQSNRAFDSLCSVWLPSLRSSLSNLQENSRVLSIPHFPLSQALASSDWQSHSMVFVVFFIFFIECRLSKWLSLLALCAKSRGTRPSQRPSLKPHPKTCLSKP